MSLKAYDGMMTRRGFTYLYEKIKENLPLFLEASEAHLTNAFAEAFVEYADKGVNPKSLLVFSHTTKEDKSALSEIKVEQDTTILSFLWQVSKVLTRSEFSNPFTSHLSLSVEPMGKKILVYPGIFVPKHREILLSFLEDWYAQNQTDPPEEVPARQWNQRCKDWLKFDEVRGIKMRIHVFDPNHYWDNLMEHLCGKGFTNKILECVPTDEKRKERIWKDKFIALKMEDSSLDRYWKAIDHYRSEEGQKEFEEYKRNNPITLRKIDEGFISGELMPQS
jgi:hypothetical protein